MHLCCDGGISSTNDLNDILSYNCYPSTTLTETNKSIMSRRECAYLFDLMPVYLVKLMFISSARDPFKQGASYYHVTAPGTKIEGTDGASITYIAGVEATCNLNVE